MRTINIFLILFSIQCSQQNFYHGFVYDQDTKKPLNRVLVKESFNSDSLSDYTDINGYFKIENKKESVADLIFSFDGYKKDTAVTVWSQHGEKLKYRFLNKKPDTIFLKKIR
ncbi:carboxypeptidase-like regulatory domain-containing protein [Chryseobacterium sp. JJR-5R]|uniref:carboxypeptidase-like regulatory domain-containing protein n=1 Tax=Chryseobacterium sp. JJR-5R TaxID=3093923 RepID=UPI002A7559BF|nr:carboxypeptidase-like regulatory domain-containing protein [Chryseobacterium sp. JJR-5R]WPO83655.1 carboxypeptidase-like regulatory domain-containing protein [Chryseobacterium sp. JJR-5R]